MMEIVTRIGVLTAVLCAITTSQTLYVPQGISSPPNNNGPYPKLSHQYEIAIDHGPYNYEEEQVMYRNQPHEDDQDLIKHQLPKSSAYKRAEQFQQEEEKPQYSRPEERHTLIQNAVPEVYVPKPSPEVYAPKHSSEVYVPKHSSEVYAPKHSSEVYVPKHASEVYVPKHSSEVYVPKPSSEVGHSVSSVLSDGSIDDVTYVSKPEVPKDVTYPSQSPEYASKVVKDPKLPQYFTMYEKRIIADPTDKYGKGPWRYLTYGHGITYGSKEPGKVFEKGYGYIRALGRDHCNLPDHLCPPRDEKPFEYEGRKEPFFGFRPH
ncbi:uncharacterized protein LOC129217645 [Uloborus diversus]|uniref:uncharacterized protein LOC129217645 n=1 Tax=Uloborus diversus TaxID=327109 RepID=UPI00240A189C|nr:uncharacterized protein LOC129217645 [Uloborus diversus]